MVFNPYQSNLLRFVVSQCRRGVDRHRNAFGKAHAKVKLSAELGTALVVLPVYVAVRLSVLAGRKLRQVFNQQHFNTLNPQARKLLNFSGFESVGSSSTHLKSDSVSRDAIQGSAQPIFQTLVAVGACLSPVQIKVLSKLDSDPLPPDGSGLSQSRLVRWVDRWRTAARQLLSFDREIFRVDSNVELSLGRGVLSSPAQITGVASDVRTRSLLLVLDYSAVWNGLSADQQLRLRHQITAFLSHQSIQPPFHTRVLNFSAIARLMTRWMGQDRKFIQTSYPLIEPSIDSGSSLISDSKPDLECLAIQKSKAISLSTTSGFIAVLEPVLTSPFSAKLLCSEKSNHQRVRDVIEADVVSVTYIEHPLEKTLKWVDRILFWIEKQWRRIRAILHK